MSPKRRGRKAEEEDLGLDVALPDHIVITGFMGTGKSAVGRRLAEIVKRPFVDLDRVIESAEGTSVWDIIARRGEAAFRALETREAARIARLPKTVIATGGGTLLAEQNRARLLTGDTRAFVLTASVDEILNRLAHARVTRPLLAGDDPRARVEALLAERAPVYATMGEAIDTTGHGIDDIVRAILERVAPTLAARAMKAGSAGGSAGGDAGAAGKDSDADGRKIGGSDDSREVDASAEVVFGADSGPLAGVEGDDGEAPETRR